jgi:hypothetical protein
VDQIIEHNLALQFSTSTLAPDTTSIEIIFGGDHGQRAFRAGAKLILRGPTKVVKEFPIGEIEISKDNSEILNNTLFGPFNQGILRMTNGRMCTGPDPDGSIRIIRGDGGIYVTFNLDGKREAADSVLKEIPFRVFMTGDLAYYAICHGKENSTSHWCPWCVLSHANWQADGHELGELWDLEKITKVAEQVANNVEVLREKGVTTKALITTIGLDRYICPPLHILLGIGNTILSDFIGWIDRRDGLEELPQWLLDSRVNYTSALSDVIDFKEEQTVWVQLNGPQLVQLRIERTRLNGYLKRKTITAAELQVAVQQKTVIVKQIKDLVKDKQDIDDSLKYVRATARAQKTILATNEKEFPMASRRIRGVIEQDHLKPNGVDRAAHHGGDLTGPSVRNLMSKADAIFGGIKEFLLAEAVNSETLGAQAEEIINRCDCTATCLILFDGLISQIYKTSEQVEADLEGTLAQTRDFSKKALSSWRSLGLSVTLKAHVCEDHICKQMQDLKGIGDYNEEFVERLHQEGVRTNRRVQTMRDRTMKYEHVARWQEATQNPKVAEIQSLVDRKRKRKERTSDEDGGQKKCSQERHELREVARHAASSVFVQPAEPLLSARNQNISDYRTNTD